MESRGITEKNIMEKCENLDLDGRRQVLKYLVKFHFKVAEGADGSRIDLSKIPENELLGLYSFVNALDVIHNSFKNKI